MILNDVLTYEIHFSHHSMSKKSEIFFILPLYSLFAILMSIVE